MKHRHTRYHAHTEHDERPHTHRRGPCMPGVIRRVVGGLAERFGIPYGVVLAGFIVGLVFNAPLTIVAFFVALYWLKHPERVERFIGRAFEWIRDLFRSTPSASRRTYYAGADGSVFTDDMIDGYLALKAEEVERLRMTTHPVEFDMYYSL